MSGQIDELDSGLIDHLQDLEQAYQGLDGLALLRAVMVEGPLAGKIALVSSFGTESVVLLDMVATIDPETPVIFLDTGKLFPETHAYREEITALLGLEDVRLAAPATGALTRYDTGGDLHGQEPDLCCHIRKTEPLAAALAGFAGWITGRKRFQGNTRASLQVIEADASARIKLNPLAHWSSDDVERYRLLRDLPAHPLLAEGYRSVGCKPCTRPTKEDEDPRGGRWWGLDKTECGIHRPAAGGST